MITATRLRELLNYNPETGEFTRRVSTTNSVRVGDIAGSVHHTGYLRIRVDGHQYLAHRLAWLYTHGEWPKNEIDHIDGNKTNNRIANIRDVTPSVNQQNQRKARSGTGFLGVTLSQGRFRALIGVAGKQHYLGNYDTPELAHAAYLNAKRRFHEGFSACA